MIEKMFDSWKYFETITFLLETRGLVNTLQFIILTDMNSSKPHPESEKILEFIKSL